MNEPPDRAMDGERQPSSQSGYRAPKQVPELLPEDDHGAGRPSSFMSHVIAGLD
jgi:hypothetical protein